MRQEEGLYINMTVQCWPAYVIIRVLSYRSFPTFLSLTTVGAGLHINCHQHPHQPGLEQHAENEILIQKSQPALSSRFMTKLL